MQCHLKKTRDVTNKQTVTSVVTLKVENPSEYLIDVLLANQVFSRFYVSWIFRQKYSSTLTPSFRFANIGAVFLETSVSLIIAVTEIKTNNMFRQESIYQQSR